VTESPEKLISSLEKSSYRNVWSAAELQAETWSLAVGLRQCIRPSVESKTPGLDGHPLAFAPINWTVWLGPFPIAGSESVGSTHCHLSPQANREGTFL